MTREGLDALLWDYWRDVFVRTGYNVWSGGTHT